MNTLPVCLSVIFTGFSVRRSGAVIFCCLQSKRCMHAGRAAPNGANFPKGKFQSFLPYFLYFTKSRKKFPKGTSLAACRQRSREAAKDLILPQRSRHCGELIRGLQNLESPFGKGFNFVRAKSLLWWADLRFVEPRSFPERETVLFFSLVRKEPKVPQRVATLWTPGDDSKLCRR